MLKYEAAISNAATGLVFVAGALGEKPIMQEVAEQRGQTFVVTQEIRAFFRLFTLVWAAYFFLKAALYSLDGLDHADAGGDGAAGRSIGGVSLGLMIVSQRRPRAGASSSSAAASACCPSPMRRARERRRPARELAR